MMQLTPSLYFVVCQYYFNDAILSGAPPVAIFVYGGGLIHSWEYSFKFALAFPFRYILQYANVSLLMQSFQDLLPSLNFGVCQYYFNDAILSGAPPVAIFCSMPVLL